VDGLGAGCAQCLGTGYTGRVGIFELMEMNEELRRNIMANADASVLTGVARRHGMRNLSRGRLGKNLRRHNHGRRVHAGDAGV